MSRLLRPLAVLVLGLALYLHFGAAPVIDPYFEYVTHAPELQPVRPISGLGRWNTWLYMPWRYRWGIGTGEAGGRFCQEHGIHGGVSDHGQGPFPWLERFQLRFYNDHTAGKGDLHLEDAGFVRVARDPRAIRPRPLDRELLGQLQKRMGERIGVVRKSSLRVAYALDDETSWGYLVRPLAWRVNGDDAAYARWLASYYGGGRGPAPVYATYDDVRGSLDGTLREIDLSPFLDRMTYNDSVWANFIGELVATANRLDPEIPAGIVGAEAPSLWGGYDYAKLLKKVQFVEPYDHGSAPEIVRSLKAAGMPQVETHFHDDKLGPGRDSWFAWHGFAHGDRGLIGWVEGWFDGGKPRPWLDRFSVTLREIGEVQGRKLAGARRVDDGIGIYYSHPSIQVSWCLDAEPHGSTWPNRNDDERLGTSHLVRKAWETLLADAGFGYRFVGYDEVVAKGVPGDLRVLILPACYALSDIEAKRLEDFAARGGVVVADFACGLFDPHGKGRTRGATDALFGVRHDGSETRRDFFSGRLWVETDQEAGYRYRRFRELFETLKPTLREGYAVAERRLPPGVVRRVGRGRAVYLNLSPQRYLAYREEGKAGEAERRPFLTPLREAGILPWITVRRAGGAPLETVAWQKGGRTFVFILQNPIGAAQPMPTAPPIPLEVELTGTVRGVRDERTGRKLPDGRRFQFSLVPSEAVLWSFEGTPTAAGAAAAAGS